jgi:hypothetical protein
VSFTTPSFSIADSADIAAVDSGSLAVTLVVVDSFFGTPAVPTVPTCIQYVNGTANQPVVTLPNVTQAGNCLVACLSTNGPGDTLPPANQGWQLFYVQGTGGGYGSSAYCVWPNHPGGQQSFTWQFDLSGGGSDSVVVAEFAGMPPAVALEQAVNSTTQGANSYTYAGTTVPTASNELILCGVQSASATTMTATVTANSLGTDSDNNFYAWGLTGTGVVSQTITVNNNPSQSSFIVLRAAVESVTP